MVFRKTIIKRIIIIIIIILILLLLLYHSKWFWRFIYPLKYRELILSYSLEYELDPHLIAAIIFVESRFIPTARSFKGAMGLMQIMPETGKWIAEQQGYTDFDINELYNPDINIRFGCWYLSLLEQQFDTNNLIVTLAAYNAGRGNVSRWEQDLQGENISIDGLPFKETRDYIKQVLKAYKYYSDLYKFKNEVRLYNTAKSIDIDYKFMYNYK